MRSRRILRRHKDRTSKIEKAAVKATIGGRMRRMGKGRWWVNGGCCSGGSERGIIKRKKEEKNRALSLASRCITAKWYC